VWTKTNGDKASGLDQEGLPCGTSIINGGGKGGGFLQWGGKRTSRSAGVFCWDARNGIQLVNEIGTRDEVGGCTGSKKAGQPTLQGLVVLGLQKDCFGCGELGKEERRETATTTRIMLANSLGRFGKRKREAFCKKSHKKTLSGWLGGSREVLVEPGKDRTQEKIILKRGNPGGSLQRKQQLPTSKKEQTKRKTFDLTVDFPLEAQRGGKTAGEEDSRVKVKGKT